MWPAPGVGELMRFQSSWLGVGKLFGVEKVWRTLGGWKTLVEMLEPGIQCVCGKCKSCVLKTHPTDSCYNPHVMWFRREKKTE